MPPKKKSTPKNPKTSSCIGKPCPGYGVAKMVCDTFDGTCHRWASPHGKLVRTRNAEILKTNPKANLEYKGIRKGTNGMYPPEFEKLPGDDGFSEYIEKEFTKRVPKRQIGPYQCNTRDKPNRQQKFVSWFIHPKTPFERLLMCHQLGTGKSGGMAGIINNFYSEKMPIIILVKNKSQEENFYKDIIKRFYDDKAISKHMRWVATKYKQNGHKGRPDLETVKKYLEFFKDPKGKKRKPGDPEKPFKVYMYTKNEALNNDLLPTKGKFDNCLVICDEAHNLWNHPKEWSTVQSLNAKKIFEALISAQSARVVLATATPLVEDMDKDIDNIKKVLHVQGSTQGYVSYFMDRHPKMYATTTPNVSLLPNITYVALDGKNLDYYLRFRCNGKKVPTNAQKKMRKEAYFETLVNGIPGTVLEQVVKNNPAKYGKGIVQQDKNGILVIEKVNGRRKLKKVYKSIAPKPIVCPNFPYFDEDNTGSATIPFQSEYEYISREGNQRLSGFTALKVFPKLSFSDAAQYATKLGAIAETAVECKGKVAIHIYKSNGLFYLVNLIQKLLKSKNKNISLCNYLCYDEKDRKKLRNKPDKNDEIKDLFNLPSNSVGETMKILVMEGATFDESVSLYEVNHFILADLSPRGAPPQWLRQQQRIARALRGCGHHRKSSKAEKTLAIHIFLTIIDPSKIPSPYKKQKLTTVDEVKLRFLKDSKIESEERYNTLKNMAADKDLYVQDFPVAGPGSFKSETTRKYIREAVPPDGWCAFHAVDQCLQHIGVEGFHKVPGHDQVPLSLKELPTRKEFVYSKSNQEWLKKFIKNKNLWKNDFNDKNLASPDIADNYIFIKTKHKYQWNKNLFNLEIRNMPKQLQKTHEFSVDEIKQIVSSVPGIKRFLNKTQQLTTEKLIENFEVVIFINTGNHWELIYSKSPCEPIFLQCADYETRKKCRNALLKKYHPDKKTGDKETFNVVKSCFDALPNEEKIDQILSLQDKKRLKNNNLIDIAKDFIKNVTQSLTADEEVYQNVATKMSPQQERFTVLVESATNVDDYFLNKLLQDYPLEMITNHTEKELKDINDEFEFKIKQYNYEVSRLKSLLLNAKNDDTEIYEFLIKSINKIMSTAGTSVFTKINDDIQNRLNKRKHKRMNK